MVRASEVTQGIYRMQVPAERLNGLFSVYLVQGDGGALIEPGPPVNVPGILEGLGGLGYDPARLAYIIPTHIHLDHGGGTGLLLQHCPRAQVVLHPLGKRHMVDPSRLIASTRMAFGENFEEFWGQILPVREERVVVPEDGQGLALGERELQIVYSPGHAPHHLSILDRKSGGLFCGEALGTPTPSTGVPTPAAAAPGFVLEDYLATMEKLRVLKPRLLLYSHGGVGWEVEPLIQKAMENTRLCAEKVAGWLKEGLSDQQITANFLAFLRQLTGAEGKGPLRAQTAEGYLFYYKRKGQSG